MIIDNLIIKGGTYNDIKKALGQWITLYVDKPMRGHSLMQAIARVNRVFTEGKSEGLVVDYLGIAQELKTALAAYTESGGEGKPTLDQELAVAKMLELPKQ